ncbi:uncharacterized protein ISCGN_026546 [Ixodes scapularis]
MLRACGSRNERRRQLRWVRERALNQTRDIERRSLDYSSVESHELHSPGNGCSESAPPLGSPTGDAASRSTPSFLQGDPQPRAEGSPFVRQDAFFADDTSDDTEDEATIDSASRPSLQERLRGWVGRHNVTHAAVNDLLFVLKDEDPSLPADARTLLETPRQCPIRQLSKGEYVHFGLKAGLIKCLSSGLVIPNADTLHLTVNVDGLPLFDNSSQQFWPILAMVSETRDQGPFPVGVFSWTKKPANVQEYLEEFVKELNQAQQEGVECLGKKWHVAIRAVVCDYPARVFVKCTKGHTAHYGCDKCVQYGVWKHRMTFPETKAELRTDDSFSAMKQEEHHTGVSPFSSLGIGMISCFPIDYMHMILLGVVRKFIKYWATGPFTVRRSASQLDIISGRISMLRPHTPSDFSRKLRTLQVRDRWKATESRLFLLYACPVVLKGILTKESFQHFMALHVAIRLLCTKDCSAELVTYADQLLNYFAEKASSPALYGETVDVYNVHGLVHLAEDVRRLGCLDSFSSFPFENYLGIIKKKLRSGNRPLAQVFKRMAELSSAGTTRRNKDGELRGEHCEGPVPPAFEDARQFQEVFHRDHSLRRVQGDNCVLLSNNTSAIIDNILSYEGVIYIVGRLFGSAADLYTFPCKSSLLGVTAVSCLSPRCSVWKLQDIKAKCFLYPCDSGHACFPILHSSSA